MKVSGTIRVLIIAFTLLKLLLLFFLPVPRLWEDHDMALNLLQTGDLFYMSDGVKFYTYQFPVYPFLLACIYKISGVTPLAAAALNVILNGCSAFIIYLLAKNFFEYFLPFSSLYRFAERCAVVSSVLFLLHPGISYYAVCNIHPFSLDLFLLFSSLLCTLLYLLIPSVKRLTLFACVLGILILDRASLVVVLIPFLFLLFKQCGFAITVRRFSAVICITSLIVLPWLVRNYYKEGIIGFEASVARDLWKGSMPQGEGSSYLANGHDYHHAISEEEGHLILKMSPAEQYRYFNSKYLQLWSDDPGQVLKMYLIKLKNFWWFRNGAGSEYPPGLQSFLPFYMVGYAVLLLLAVIALFHVRGTFTLFSVALGLGFLQSIFYVETRHRMIIEPLLILFAVIAIFALYDRFRSKPTIAN